MGHGSTGTPPPGMAAPPTDLDRCFELMPGRILLGHRGSPACSGRVLSGTKQGVFVVCSLPLRDGASCKLLQRHRLARESLKISLQGCKVEAFWIDAVLVEPGLAQDGVRLIAVRVPEIPRHGLPRAPCHDRETACV